MQRPGHKINPREADPNQYITFIRALDTKRDSSAAEHILKAIAAQVKKIMEQRFMLIGTLEEAEHNLVFAGRNWNYGQSVELVLRRPGGKFLPLPYIMSVMCHEMAHITHMNHGPEFKKLNAAIKRDVAALQARGYYGDGFWSDGKRLNDNVKMGAEGLKASDFPEYICGVSAADARKSKRKGRGPASSRAPGLVQGEASNRSGRQTDYRRKAGRRINTDMGEGSRLDGRREIGKDDREARKLFIDDCVKELVARGMSLTKAKSEATQKFDEENPWWKDGSTRGKRAASKTAAELRAAAAEQRLASLNAAADIKLEEAYWQGIKIEADGDDSVKEDEDEDDIVILDDPRLTIEDRRREMEAEMSEHEMDELRGGWEEYLAPPASSSKRKGLSDIGVKEEALFDHEPPAKRSSNGSTGRPKSDIEKVTKGGLSPTRPRFDAVNLIRQERLRALGLEKTTSTSTERTVGTSGRQLNATIMLDDGGSGWACRRCTFRNLLGSARCEMCQARPGVD